MRLLFVATALVLLNATVSTALDPDAVLRKEAGNFYLKSRQYEQARNQYLAALALEPDYADVHYNLGVLYFFRLGGDSRALYHLTRYAKLRPHASDLGQVQSLVSQALERIEETERKAYADTVAEGTLSAFRAFLERHPDGYYAADARKKIQLLEEYQKEVERRRQAMQSAYERVLERKTVEAADAFLSDYPDAPMAAEAQRLRKDWAEQRKREEQAFLTAVETGTRDALRAFLDRHPESAYTSEVRNRLQKLESAEEAYRIAAASRSIPALEVFLSTYPDSPRTEDAQQEIAALRKEATAREEAEAAYREAADARTVQALEAFLRRYPGSERARDAELLLDALRQEAALREEQEAERKARRERERLEAAYRQAVDAGTVTALQKFLDEHPDSGRSEDARQRLENLKRRQAERAEAERKAREEAQAAARREAQARQAREEARAAWEQAEEADTPAAYLEFFRTHPDHPQAEEARRRAAAMQPPEVPAVRAPSAPEPAPPPPPEPSPPTLSAREKAWETARSQDAAESYREFLEQYPEGDEAEAARNRLSELETPPEEETDLTRSKRKALERYRRMLLGQ